MRQQFVNPEQQVTQGGCLRLLGYLLPGLGIVVGILVIASFGKTLGGGNSQQQPTTLDDIQQYVFDNMAKPVQDYRLDHFTATFGRDLGMGLIVVEYADGTPTYPIPSGIVISEPGTEQDTNAVMSSANSMMPGDLSRQPCNTCRPVENWIKLRSCISLSLLR